jgi:hypothetical protein
VSLKSKTSENKQICSFPAQGGGYQPAQKWLKDRKDRTLSNAEIEHYQKIIGALAETDRILGEIDNIV